MNVCFHSNMMEKLIQPVQFIRGGLKHILGVILMQMAVKVTTAPLVK